MHFSKIYLIQENDNIYFCHKKSNYLIPNEPIKLYDESGNFVKSEHNGYHDEMVEITPDSYKNNNSRYSYTISYNFKQIKIFQAFNVQLTDYCESRINMMIISCFLNGLPVDNFNSYYNQSDVVIIEEADSCFNYSYYIDSLPNSAERTYKNGFPIEIIGCGGKACFIKIHKSIKPLLFADLSIDKNLKYYNQYFETKNKLNIRQMLDISIRFLNNFYKLIEIKAKINYKKLAFS